MSDLAGPVALVTGAGRGIGRAIAVGLAAEGMGVGCLSRSPQPLADTVTACRDAGGRAIALAADVTDAAAVRGAVATVEAELGPVELLVNNAGGVDAAEQPPWQADSDAWWSVVETNLRGPFIACNAVLPGMVARGSGRVVNVNAGMGTRAVPGYSAYSVSKAGLARLTDCLAAALWQHGVCVFDISPGLVRTDMTEGMPMWDDATDDQWTPVSRMVDLVVAVAAGRVDRLSGRFLHAGRDDLDRLLAAAERIEAEDARVLRLTPYGEDDPLA